MKTLAGVLGALMLGLAPFPAAAQETDDSRAGATELKPGETAGQLTSSADRDWYVFSAAGNHTLTVALQNDSGCLIHGDLHVAESTDQAKPLEARPGERPTWQFLPMGAAWYYVEITSAGSSDCASANYRLVADYVPHAGAGTHPVYRRCIAAKSTVVTERKLLARLRQKRADAPTRRRRLLYRAKITRQQRVLKRAQVSVERTC